MKRASILLLISWIVIIAIVVAVLSLMSCASVSSTMDLTKSGVLIYDYSLRIDPDYVEKVAKCIVKKNDVDEKLLWKLTIIFQPGYMVDCNGLISNGCYYNHLNLIYVAIRSNNPEGWRGTLRHELKHWILDLKGLSSQSHYNEIFLDDSDC